MFFEQLQQSISTDFRWGEIAINLAVIFLGAVSVWFICASFRLGPYKIYANLPPGPRSNFLTGTPGYQTEKSHMWFKQLSEQYGPIFSVWKGTNLQIVLNTPTLIKELLDKRGVKYSSRPPMWVMHNYIFEGISIVSTAYGDVWRKQRKVFNSLVGPATVHRFLPYQDFESKQYVVDMLDSPEKFFFHAERFGASILTSTTYGVRIHSLEHESAQPLVYMGNWLESRLTPAQFADDRWPILQWLPRPLAPWRAAYDQDRVTLKAIAKAWWNPVKRSVETATDSPCFASRFYKSYQEDGWTEEQAALVALGLLLAGSGTTASIQNFLVLGCVTNPEAVKKAHEELDRVVGDSRLPTLEDETSLPYIRAMIKETMRWRPFSNQGFYHATSKDDWYGQYFIPTGTTIIANAFSVHHDEAKYPDPDRFHPDRYINYPLSAQEYVKIPNAEDRDHFAYGAGRRICVGMPLSEASLFLLTSRLLWGFNIEPAKNASGEDVCPDTLGYAPGIFAKPNPFPAKVSPRSEKRSELMRAEFAKTPKLAQSLSEKFDAGAMRELERVSANLRDSLSRR